MKHLKQIAIILAVSFAGEALHSLIPLPVPGSIYGLLLMLALLMTGVVKIHEVKAVGDWLICHRTGSRKSAEPPADRGDRREEPDKARRDAVHGEKY